MIAHSSSFSLPYWVCNSITPWPRDEQGGFWADMLGAALSEVNWQELAEHYIADVDKEMEEA